MSSLFKSKNHSSEPEDSHWLSISDLMSGLMMVFLFISIALMRHSMQENNQIKEIAVAYQQNQVSIYKELMKEFKKDLPKWNAKIDESTLTFTFQAPDVLFKVGDIKLSDKYMKLLDDFFPRYMKVLAPFRDSINEVRIEGHTSSIWNHYSSDKEAYFNNMQLSQGRTRSVLQYAYNLSATKKDRPWIKSHVAAVGLSSSKPIYNSNGRENRAKSRRVSFRVITNSDIQIKKILERTQ